jgi:hypothetical protein
MATVTDPELLRVLNEKRKQAIAPSSAQSASASPVNDPDLLRILNEKRQRAVVEQESVKAMAEPEQAQKPTGTSQLGQLETAATMASSVVAEPLAGLWGAFNTVMSGGNVEMGVRALENARTAMTYQPRTQAGEFMTGQLGEALGPVGDALEHVNESLGNFAYDVTGSPAAAAAAYSMPTLLLEVGGFKGFRALKANDPAALKIKEQQKLMLEDPVQRYNADVADVKLDRKGNIVPDPVAEKLIDLGFRRHDASVVTNSTPETKQMMNQMLDDFVAGSKNPVEAQTRKVTDAIGASVGKRLAAFSHQRKVLGKQLDGLVENDLAGVTVDLSPAVTDFAEMLQKDFGLRLGVDSKGKYIIENIQNTPLIAGSLSLSRGLVKDAVEVINQQATSGVTSARQAHKIKKVLDELVEAGKLGEPGIKSKTQGRLLKLRQDINNTILDTVGDTHPYAKTNNDLSSLIESMKPFNKFLDEGSTWTDAKVQGVVGNAMKAMRGESKTASVLTEDIAKLEATARKMGMVMPDDPRALTAFYDTLNNFYKVTEDDIVRSIGKLSDAQKAKLASGAASFSVGNVFGLVHDIAKIRQLGLDKKQLQELMRSKQEGTVLLRKALTEQ